MSTIPNEIEDEDLFEVRQTPFVMVPVWVQLNASPMAWATYAALALHVNNKRGDRIVWPTQQVLAERLGLRNAKAVRPYLVELEEIGAIVTKTQRYAKGMRVRTVYHLRLEPPRGFTGPTSLDDVPPAGGDETPADQGVVEETAGRTEGCWSTPRKGCSSTQELDEEKLDKPPTGTTTDARARTRARTVTISEEDYPLTDAMRERVTRHLGDLHLSAADVEAQHAAWVRHHAGKTLTPGRAQALWWGWMSRAWRRCSGLKDMPITDADRAYAAQHWPDIDLDVENARFVALAMERDWRFTKAGWDRAWWEHMRAAQEDAA